jgi:hypothetical protein
MTALEPMMRSTLMAVLAGAAIQASAPAWSADNGLVIGGALGQSRTELRVGNFNLKDNDAGFRFFGGLRPLDQLGVELEYADFGRAASGAVSSDHTAWGAFVIGYLPLPPSFDLYGKLGLASWQGNTHLLSGNISDNGNDVAYGAGLQLRLGSLGTRLEYEEFGVSHGSKLGIFSLGLAWTIL